MTVAGMARTLPNRRKIEEAFAGVLIDAQAADPTFLPGLTIVCGTTGRSPDDPLAAQKDQLTEPELPYLSVSCPKLQADPDMPPSTGIKLADLIFHAKTHATDEARATADERLQELEYFLEDEAAILASINIPADPATPDTRRVKELYVYAFHSDDQADAHNEDIWMDQLSQVVVMQGFDPDNADVAG